MTMSKRCSENEDEVGQIRTLIQELGALLGKFKLSEFIWWNDHVKKLDIPNEDIWVEYLKSAPYANGTPTSVPLILVHAAWVAISVLASSAPSSYVRAFHELPFDKTTKAPILLAQDCQGTACSPNMDRRHSSPAHLACLPLHSACPSALSLNTSGARGRPIHLRASLSRLTCSPRLGLPLLGRPMPPPHTLQTRAQQDRATGEYATGFVEMESENAGEGGNLTGDVLSVGMMEDGGVSQCVTQSMDNATVIPQSRKQRKKKDNVLMDAMTTSLGQMIKVFGAYVENSGNQLASIVYWVGYEQDAAIAHRNKLVEFPKIEGLSMQHGNEEVYKIACDFIK
ncbi:unnamed protein product, partial [Ilex paraguariensis]